MAFTTLPAAGSRLYASTLSALITDVRPLYVRKTADETVNNSATLQNDDELALSLSASCDYAIEGTIFYSTGTTPDIKFAFTYPTGSTLSWVGAGYKFDGVAFESEWRTSAWQAASGTSNAVAGTTASYDTAHPRGIIRVGSTAGTLQLQWAQNTANASNTIVKADSFLIARRVN